MQKRHEGQPKHVKQGSLSSSSSNSTVSSIASKYDVNQLKKEISQAKSRVCKHSRQLFCINKLIKSTFSVDLGKAAEPCTCTST